MYFQLQLPEYELPLTCCVGKDGQLYWRCVDIGRHLPADMAPLFLDTCDGVRAMDIAVRAIPYGLRKEKWMSTEGMCHWMSQIYPGFGEEFERAVTHGQCDVRVEERRYQFPERMPIICVADQGSEQVDTWIQSLIRETVAPERDETPCRTNLRQMLEGLSDQNWRLVLQNETGITITLPSGSWDIELE